MSIDSTPITDAFNEAADAVYHAGGFDVSQMADPKTQKVIEETLRCISGGINTALPTDVPETLRYALENNAFIFSGLKTFHALREVGLSMVKDDGSIKSFEEFKDDVKQINSKYNTNYLYAEYKHAVGTSQMAAKWVNIEADGDRYDLQYRTAGDDKVRPDHAALNGITLPPSDPFWSKYYPPNGWGCRCTAVQVRVGKYPRSNPADAMQAGDVATDEAKQKMFRYNSGQTMHLFPDKHPYYKAPAAAKDAVVGYVSAGFDARTIEEAEQQFTDKLGVKCSLKGMKKKNMQQVADIFASVEKHFKLHPELRDKIKFVGTSQGRQMLYEELEYQELKARYPSFPDASLRRYAKSYARKACSAGSNTYAYSAPSEKHGLNGLAFNATYQGEKVETSLKRDVSTKWHPVGCDTLKSIFDHELGHKLDELLGLCTDSDFLRIFKEAELKGADYIHENLSRYAYNPKNGRITYREYDAHKEFIAEAWSEYLNNDKPRPIASAVGMLVLKKYKELVKKP